MTGEMRADSRILSAKLRAASLPAREWCAGANFAREDMSRADDSELEQGQWGWGIGTDSPMRLRRRPARHVAIEKLQNPLQRERMLEAAVQGDILVVFQWTKALGSSTRCSIAYFISFKLGLQLVQRVP